MATTRRELLSQLGAAAALGLLPRAASAASPFPPGQIVRPGDLGYDDARAVYNDRFDVFPSAVLFAQSAQEVAGAVRWARAKHVPFRARAGRHSYEGYSVVQNGLVIDVSALDEVTVHPQRRIARVGAGVGLLDLYEALWAEGVTLPGGSCPTVGIAGLALGGGFGLLARSRGLTCDNLLEVELVNAQGHVVRAHPFRNQALFWALRGGGGGNFGIATSFLFQVRPIGNVAIYSVRWPFDELPEVVDTWQRWAPHVDDRLVSVLQLKKTQVSSAGQFDGTAAELQSLLAPLLAVGTPTNLSVEELPFIEAVRLFGGLRPERPELALGLSLDHATFKNTSAYAYAPFGAQALSTLVTQLHAAPGPDNILQFDAHGGAVRRVPSWATAFFHRRALFSLQYQAYWTHAADAAPNIAWVDGFRNAMRPFTVGAYVNYIDAAIPNWPSAFYGGNLPSLRVLKRVHDPANVFRFPQSIPPA